MAIHSDHKTTSLFPGNGDYIFAALIAVIVYVISTYKFGPGITFDSVNYLNAASTIEEGMKKTDGTPFYDWPPLFPAILSIATFIHLDVFTFAVILHGLIYVANILITLFLLKKYITHKSLFIIASIVLLFSLPLLQVHILIWSEPIFILLILFNLLIAKEYFNSGSTASLIKLIVISILFFLERKSGIYFILSNAILISLIKKPKWLIQDIIYSTTSLIPVAIWFLIKHNQSGKFFGSADWQWQKIFIILRQFTNAFGSHFIPTPFPFQLKLIFLIAISISLYLIFRKTFNRHTIKENKILILSSFYAFMYYLLLIFSLFYINISEEIDDRILSPVYLLLILSIFIFLDTQMQNLPKKYILVLLITLSIWTIYPVYRTLYNIKRWNSIGTGGYNRIDWHKNLIIRDLEKRDLNEKVLFTNDINALIYYLNFRSNKKIKILPDSSTVIAHNALLVCLANHGNFPQEGCLSDRWKNKKIIISNKDGKVWDLLTKKN